jgi:hypothetical protein
LEKRLEIASGVFNEDFSKETFKIMHEGGGLILLIISVVAQNALNSDNAV